MSRNSETAVPSPSFSINLCWENEETVLDEGIITHDKSDPISTAELVHSVSAFLQRVITHLFQLCGLLILRIVKARCDTFILFIPGTTQGLVG